ncbi:Uncharacterised protein [Mycobacterium tuberculosis]|nr:Uncharacterised protein [Mycobacterium tuberculosis]
MVHDRSDDVVHDRRRHGGDRLGNDRGEAVERTLRLLIRVGGAAAGEDGERCPGERAETTPKDGGGYAASGGPSVHVVLPL